MKIWAELFRDRMRERGVVAESRLERNELLLLSILNIIGYYFHGFVVGLSGWNFDLLLA